MYAKDDTKTGLVFIVNALKKLTPEMSELINDKELSDAFGRSEVLKTEYKGHAVNLAFHSALNDVKVCVAVGGDGTFSEVANGLLQAGNRDVIMVMVPNGSGNDFCRARQVTFSYARLKTAILAGDYRLFDAAVIRFDEGRQIRYLINIADIGLGGYTATLFGEQRKWGLPGSLSYTISIIRSFLGFSKPQATVTADGKVVFEGRMMMTAVCNSSTFAGGVVIHPGADPSDGLLDLTIVGDVTVWTYLANYINLRRGKWLTHPGISYHKGHTIRVSIKGDQNRMEADGEIFGRGDAEIEVLPQAIKIIC